MRYQPSLDGLRALAVLAVLATHAQLPFTAGGWTGVEVFFVLSGYLITSVLLVEHSATGRIQLRRFYMRRILRLYPVLLVALVAGVAFYRGLSYDKTLPGYGVTAASAALYVQNISPLFSHDLLIHSGFAQTWSLAVEEQFYLIWPPIMIWVLSRGRDPLRWAGVLCAASFVALTISMPFGVFQGFPTFAYYLPWSRMGGLLLGCCLAIVVQRRSAPRFLCRPSVGWGLAAIAVAVTLIAGKLRLDPHLWWQDPLIAATAAGLIWHITSTPSSNLGRALRVRWLVWLGRRSYGIYVLHFAVLSLLINYSGQRRAVIAVLMFVGTILLAAMSYRLVEMPFLMMKKRFGPDLVAAPQVDGSGSGPLDRALSRRSPGDSL